MRRLDAWPAYAREPIDQLLLDALDATADALLRPGFRNEIAFGTLKEQPAAADLQACRTASPVA